MENEKNNNQLQIELKEEVAQGTYANLAIITHSSSEFIVDFVRVMPGLPKAGVQSRIVLRCAGNLRTGACGRCARELRKYAEVRIDHNNNVIGELGNPDSHYHIMLDAHLDQIGFIITSVDEKGFLRFAPVGGLDRRVMAGSPVTVFGKEPVTGIVCCMPPHLSDGGEDKALPFDKMALDVGLTGEAAKERIPLGSRGILYSQPQELLNNLAVRWGFGRPLRRGGTAAHCGNSVGRKTGRQSNSSLQRPGGNGRQRSDNCGLSDLSPGGDYGGRQLCQAAWGLPRSQRRSWEGPMIGVSPALNPKVTELLFETAKKEKIPYQTEVMGGVTGTNADEAAVAKGGVACGLVSIPQRNMHTPAEIISLDDVENTARLLASYIMDRGCRRD